jgi:hypothetical protein
MTNPVLSDTLHNPLILGIPQISYILCAYNHSRGRLVLTMILILQSQMPQVSQTHLNLSQSPLLASIESLDHESLLCNKVYRELYHSYLGIHSKLEYSQ